MTTTDSNVDLDDGLFDLDDSPNPTPPVDSSPARRLATAAVPDTRAVGSGELLPRRRRVRSRVPRPHLCPRVARPRHRTPLVLQLVAPHRNHRPSRSPLESLGNPPPRPRHRRQHLAPRPRRPHPRDAHQPARAVRPLQTRPPPQPAPGDTRRTTAWPLCHVWQLGRINKTEPAATFADGAFCDALRRTSASVRLNLGVAQQRTRQNHARITR